VGPSVAYDATSMNELRKWNEMYGEGGSRTKSPFGFGDRSWRKGSLVTYYQCFLYYSKAIYTSQHVKGALDRYSLYTFKWSLHFTASAKLLFGILFGVIFGISNVFP